MEKAIIRIIDRKILWEGRFLRCILTTYVDSSGIIREWESFERVNCKGIVVIVPITEEEKVILTRQFRPPVNEYVIEFPAGLNERGDPLEEVSRRELLEETGYSAKEIIFIGKGPLSSGSSGEVLTAFLAKGLEFKGIGDRDETEDIEVIKIPIEEIYDRLSILGSEGNLIDLKIYGLLELAKKYM
ncbi:MAG: NUDIX hydrolase [Thermodesulfovibrionales bacterium]